MDSDSSPVSVSLSGDSRRNVIVWMDHRAVDQAERINSSKSPVLEYCGGAVSPEMEPPKVLYYYLNQFHNCTTGHCTQYMSSKFYCKHSLAYVVSRCKKKLTADYGNECISVDGNDF